MNVASRLQAEAPVGAVVIGEETFRRLGSGAFVEPMPPKRVKGKQQPLHAYLLRALDGSEPSQSPP